MKRRRCRDIIAALTRCAKSKGGICAGRGGRRVRPVRRRRLLGCLGPLGARRRAERQSDHPSARRRLPTPRNVGLHLRVLPCRDYVPSRVLLLPLDEEANAALTACLSELAGRNISVISPRRGEAKGLCELALANAAEAVRAYREQCRRTRDSLASGRAARTQDLSCAH